MKRVKVGHVEIITGQSWIPQDVQQMIRYYEDQKNQSEETKPKSLVEEGEKKNEEKTIKVASYPSYTQMEASLTGKSEREVRKKYANIQGKEPWKATIVCEYIEEQKGRKYGTSTKSLSEYKARTKARKMIEEKKYTSYPSHAEMEADLTGKSVEQVYGAYYDIYKKTGEPWAVTILSEPPVYTQPAETEQTETNQTETNQTEAQNEQSTIENNLPTSPSAPPNPIVVNQYYYTPPAEITEEGGFMTGEDEDGDGDKDWWEKLQEWLSENWHILLIVIVGIIGLIVALKGKKKKR